MKSTSGKRPAALRGGAQTRPTSSFLGRVLVGVASRMRDATASALASLDLSPREFGLLNHAVHEPQRTQSQLGEALRIACKRGRADRLRRDVDLDFITRARTRGLVPAS